MLKIENTEVLGWEHAIRGMRNPMNSWEKSDSKISTCECEQWPHSIKKSFDKVGPNDLDLMTRLRNAGTDHRKFMRMIAVYVDLTGPLYWWKEFDTYKVGTVANSCSTMHKIAVKEFSQEDFSREHLFGPDDSLKKTIAAVAKLDSTSGVPQSVYVAEECSELVKELMKKERRKGNNFAIIDEACDVLTTVFIMLYQYGVTEWTIQQNILAKCKRALERYEKFGEL